jgi:ribosomal protein S18 acetylase RimI-like enzyme
MKIRLGNFSEVCALHNQIPELSPIAGSDYLSARIGENDYLLLVCEQDGIPVAYKLGYWTGAEYFYSWLGGVHPAYRQRGIAKALLLEQEAQVREMGAKEIRVKSMNQYTSMLLLLISQGYEITGAGPNAKGEVKIQFAKTLSK